MKNDISEIKRELDEITKIITNTVPVEAIYLFGSYAYGAPHKNSDLDLYIVFSDNLQIRVLEAIIEIRKAIKPVKKMPMDIIGLKNNRFIFRKKHATLERKIEREGIKLYG
ncbi:MAG: nucleotidyltransferase domain-containing protein [Treponema sp.]|nr:nucleotidyltransferase domain-containing protein [Treponema sp.]